MLWINWTKQLKQHTQLQESIFLHQSVFTFLKVFSAVFISKYLNSFLKSAPDVWEYLQCFYDVCVTERKYTPQT